MLCSCCFTKISGNEVWKDGERNEQSHGHGVYLPKVTGLGHLTSSRGKLAFGQEQPVSGCARCRCCAGGSVAAGCPAAFPPAYSILGQVRHTGNPQSSTTVGCSSTGFWCWLSVLRQNPPPAKWYLPQQHWCLHGINHCSSQSWPLMTI